MLLLELPLGGTRGSFSGPILQLELLVDEQRTAKQVSCTARMTLPNETFGSSL